MGIKKGNKVVCVILRSTGALGSLEGFDVGAVYEADRDDHIKGRGNWGCKPSHWKDCFKLVESNPMPTLEAGMVVEVRSVAHNYTESYVVVGDTLQGINSGAWDKTSLIQDGSLLVEKVYKKIKCSIQTSLENLGDPIWTATPEKTELEKKKEALIEKANEALAQADALRETARKIMDDTRLI